MSHRRFFARAGVKVAVFYVRRGGRMKEPGQASGLLSLGQIFYSRLANLFRRHARARKQFGNPGRQLFRFEPLEDRILLSADLSGVAVLDSLGSLAFQTASGLIARTSGLPR